MRTPYDEENGDFTKLAHKKARQVLYPKALDRLYRNESYEIEYHGDSSGDAPVDLDGEHGIDVTISFDTEFRPDIPVFVQERFRRPNYQQWQDIVLTEWNLKSGTPSELGKIKADHFVYGYYDENKDEILEALIVEVVDLKRALVEGAIKCDTGRTNPKDQRMVGVKFAELQRYDVRYLHYRDGDLHYNGYDVGQNDATQEAEPSVVVAKEPVQSVFVGGDQ